MSAVGVSPCSPISTASFSGHCPPAVLTLVSAPLSTEEGVVYSSAYSRVLPTPQDLQFFLPGTPRSQAKGVDLLPLPTRLPLTVLEASGLSQPLVNFRPGSLGLLGQSLPSPTHTQNLLTSLAVRSLLLSLQESLFIAPSWASPFSQAQPLKGRANALSHQPSDMF